MGAFVSASARDFAGAIEFAERAIHLVSPSPPAQYIRAVALAELGRLDKALTGMQIAAESSGHHPSTVAGRAYIQSRRGLDAEASALIHELERRHQAGDASAFDLAEAYVAVKRYEDSMQALERAYQDRAPELLGVAVDPLFTSMHDWPGFRELTVGIGIR